MARMSILVAMAAVCGVASAGECDGIGKVFVDDVEVPGKMLKEAALMTQGSVDFIGVPLAMRGGCAFVPPLPVAAGAKLRIEAVEEADAYFTTYHCKPCSDGRNGDLNKWFTNNGWESGSCAPRFIVAGSTATFPMVAFKGHFPQAGSVTTAPVVGELSYGAVFIVPGRRAVWCAAVAAAVAGQAGVAGPAGTVAVDSTEPAIRPLPALPEAAAAVAGTGGFVRGCGPFTLVNKPEMRVAYDLGKVNGVDAIQITQQWADVDMGMPGWIGFGVRAKDERRMRDLDVVGVDHTSAMREGKGTMWGVTPKSTPPVTTLVSVTQSAGMNTAVFYRKLSDFGIPFTPGAVVHYAYSRTRGEIFMAQHTTANRGKGSFTMHICHTCGACAPIWNK